MYLEASGRGPGKLVGRCEPQLARVCHNCNQDRYVTLPSRKGRANTSSFT
jgi:hypothetical protein